METAAVRQVAYANRVSFIGVRSLSDLASGRGKDQAQTFFRLGECGDGGDGVCDGAADAGALIGRDDACGRA